MPSFRAPRQLMLKYSLRFTTPPTPNWAKRQLPRLQRGIPFNLKSTGATVPGWDFLWRMTHPPAVCTVWLLAIRPTTSWRMRITTFSRDLRFLSLLTKRWLCRPTSSVLSRLWGYREAPATLSDYNLPGGYFRP